MDAEQAAHLDTIRTEAVAGTIMYLPQMAALTLGLFATEGLHVEAKVPGPGALAANAVLAGRADFALGGIWRPAMYVSLRKPLIAVAAITKRSPGFLLTRPGRAAAGWNGLEGSKVILCGDAPSSWVVLHAQCVTHGVRLDRVSLIPDFAPEEGAELFTAGFGDYIYVGQPATERLLMVGTAEPVASMAEAAGPLPWSVFMTTPDFLTRHADRVQRFVRALDRALRWIAQERPNEIARAMAPAYPHIEPPLLERVVARYKQLGAWPLNTIIEADDLAAWERLLLANGMLQSPMEWSLVVDNSFGRAAAAET